MAELLWLNNETADCISVTDRGLNLADGVFETLRVEAHHVCHGSFHHARLLLGLKVLQFPDPEGVLARATAMVRTILASPDVGSEGSLRITVTRGNGPRGYLPRGAGDPNIIGRWVDGLPGSMPPAQVGIGTTRWPTQPTFAGLKLLARQEQVMAAIEADRRHLDDIVMLDQYGDCCSTSSGNLFIRQGRRLLTPCLNHAGIAGTRRRVIIDGLAEAMGYTVQEARISTDMLYRANEVFYCNSLVGIRSIGRIEDRTVSSTQAADELRPGLHEKRAE